MVFAFAHMPLGHFKLGFHHAPPPELRSAVSDHPVPKISLTDHASIACAIFAAELVCTQHIKRRRARPSAHVSTFHD
jgi:hypothetical protein